MTQNTEEHLSLPRGPVPSYGARHSHQVFKVQPKGEAFPPSFFGFLPKAMPIPPSGPSRKHNGIGLQSSNGEP
ncbi:hypothetical protein JHK82_028941 [Glycine max]|nr:hypothetical protein JHK87_028855 [Glycine soja]KAG4998162.1 hypothetical protein JHK85_029601 [Glycine max]KAG5128106.1 hypothetical protein JHK82_028941 [Glycine max]KAG5152712.1 hypothetical protein JHK84_029184 [Glycine max]